MVPGTIPWRTGTGTGTADGNCCGAVATRVYSGSRRIRNTASNNNVLKSYLIAIEGHPGCCRSLDGPGQSQERIVGPSQSQKGIVGPNQSQVPPPLVSNSAHAGQRFHIVLLLPFDVKTHFLSQLTAEQIVSHKIRAHQLVLLLKRRKKYRT